MYYKDLEKVTISFQVSELERLKIKECAGKLHIKIGDLIRLAINDYFDVNKEMLSKIKLYDGYKLFTKEELDILEALNNKL